MRYEKKSMRGVTLIEMALVLVVIGLLLGGILKGTELINNARVRSIMNEQTGIQVAWKAFVNRYGSMPGDYPQANVHIPGFDGVAPRVGLLNGNNSGDGFITATESPIAFQHLTASGLLTCTTCRATTLSAVSVLNSPTNAYGGVMAIFHNRIYSRPGAESAINRLALINALIPSNVLFELDSKLDDGLPGTGSFRLAFYNGNSASPFFRLPDCLSYSDGTRYMDGNNELSSNEIYRPLGGLEPSPQCASALLF